MKSFFCVKLSKPVYLVIILTSLISLEGNFLNAESFSEEFHIDSSTKTEEDSSEIPKNPFEIVEMIRRHNSLNNATSPSDAIDDALKIFDSLEEK